MINLKYFTKGTALVFIGLLFLAPTIIFAAVDGGNETGVGGSNTGNKYEIKIPNPLNVNETGGLPALLEKIISEAILPIGGVVIVIMIIYSGFLFVTAQGNEAKLTTAKSALLYAAIGAAILLGARVLAGVIKTTINQIG